MNEAFNPAEVNRLLVRFDVGPLLLLFGAHRSSRTSGAE